MNHNKHFSVACFARNSILTGAAAVLVFGCTTPPPPVQSGVPSVQSASQANKAPSSSPPQARTYETASPRSLADWKRNAAERIHAANRSLVYTGAPPNPLRAVVVVEMTVAADGQVRRAELLRAPTHAKDLGAVALKAVNAASPLPAPPKALVAQGAMKTTETWLFRDDGQFQLRSLALAQAVD
jgi:TonB family protein